MLEVSLVFDGYWREPNHAWVPALPGIICVYACTFYADVDKVHLDRLLYIGESEDANHFIATSPLHQQWLAALKDAQVLCYSIASVANISVREAVQKALVCHCMPALNRPFDKGSTAIHLIVTGCHSLIDGDIKIAP